MANRSTKPRSLHWLREEARAARRRHRAAVTVNVEDAIFARLVEAEELLIVAIGLFTELAEDEANWLFSHQADIGDARWALRSAIDDRATVREVSR
ncbi:MAG: hypothetical protein Q8L35_03980 [Actinomycetota bacterium]|nr:hypothetical protein [Actinomycetota bacterium]